MMETLPIMLFIKMYKTPIITQNMLMIIMLNLIMTLNNLWLNYNNLYFFFYQDSVSTPLIILTMWVVSIIIMITNKEETNNMIMLMIIMMMALVSSSLMMFYIWFEASLIPLFMIIFWWGKSKERSMASVYMLIYTMLGSLPLLLSIMYIYKTSMSMEWDYIMMTNYNNLSFIIYWNMIIAFLIKIPVPGLHTWLPKAHVEAPVYGSMILASIVLKLGGMGMMRMMLMIVPASMMYNPMLMSMMIMGVLIISLICIYQSDMKIIVALSSIVHMGMATISCMSMFSWGYSSMMIMMLGHGLCSSAMFFMVNVFYSISSSRITFLNKGFINTMPAISFLWFIMCAMNMGAPVSLSFISEIMIAINIISWTPVTIIPIIIINMLSSMFSMYLFMNTQGAPSMMTINYIKSKEYFIILAHLIPMNMIILNSWVWNF